MFILYLIDDIYESTFVVETHLMHTFSSTLIYLLCSSQTVYDRIWIVRL